MTVAELIAKLQTLDPATEVVFSGDQGFALGVLLQTGEMALDRGLRDQPEEDMDIINDPTGFPFPERIARRFPAVVLAEPWMAVNEWDAKRGWKEV